MTSHGVRNAIVCLLLLGAWSLDTSAQQAGPKPGSPGYTAPIDGKPPRVVPPKGAPNILLILTDD